MLRSQHPRIVRCELACPCRRCSGFPEDLTEIEHTEAWLEELWSILGGRTLRVLSGYRCSEYDREIAADEPGAEAHRQCRGVDLVVPSLSPATVQKLCLDHFPDLIRGIGIGKGMTHLHRGEGPPSRWRL